MKKRITEAQRRRQLAAELSETELDVLWLMRDLDNLLQMLVEFDDTRTEL